MKKRKTKQKEHKQEKNSGHGGRGRFVKDRSKSERRLDALARLLQGGSKCVAIAFINGKFQIAANELTINSHENEITCLIETVMAYFTRVAKREPITDEQRKEVLIQICSRKINDVERVFPVPRRIHSTR